MSELVVAENIKYKVTKNKKQTIFGIKKNEELENGVLFVSCGIDTGEILGRVNKVSSNISQEYSMAVSKGTIARPLVLFCATLAQAKGMFGNLKNDKKRFSKLAAEVQKQKIMNKLARQTTKLVDVLVEQPITQQESNEKKESTMERAKRLSFNNGIFKPNDNY